MAVYHGKSGKVDLGGAIAACLSWALTTVGDIAEATYMGLSWKTFVAGYKDATATTEHRAYTEGTSKVGTNAQLKLYIDDTHYFDVNTAIVTEQTETVNMNDVGRISYSYSMDATAGISYT